MNWLDIVILVLLVIAAFVGLKVGLIKTALSLAGIIVGVVLAGHFYTYLARVLAFIPQEKIANIVAFAIIFIVVIIIVGLLALILKWIANVVLLGWVDHLGGAVFGLVIGVIFFGALFTLWCKFFGTPDIVRESVLTGILLDRFPFILALFPGEFDSIRSFFR